MDWRAVTARVVVEACAASPEDVVLVLGDDVVAGALRARCTVVRGDSLADAPPGVSILILHWTLRLLPPSEQRALLSDAAKLLPARGLMVIGDLMWSLPLDQLDAPEQYGDRSSHVQTTATLESWARAAGFLPDLHRFSPGVGVLVGIRA